MVRQQLTSHRSIRKDVGMPELAPFPEKPKRSERRRRPRVEIVHDCVQGQIRSHSIPVAVLNLSEGGFLMKAPISYPVGDIQKFRFIVARHEPIVLRARVVHVTRTTAARPVCYIVGLEFIDRGHAPVDKAIDILVETALP